MNDPILGGGESPRRWWGFSSSGIISQIKLYVKENLEACHQEDAERDQ
jgi:hypothetical protein